MTRNDVCAVRARNLIPESYDPLASEGDTRVPARPAISTVTLAELADRFDLSTPAKACLAASMTSRHFLDALMTKGLVQDAAILIASVVPTRYAIAWGRHCLQQERAIYAPIVQPADPKDVCLRAVETWFCENQDEHRVAALNAARGSKLTTPESWLAAAVGYSGKSLGLSEVVPPREAVGRFVALAVTGHARRQQSFVESMQLYLSRAIEVFERDSMLDAGSIDESTRCIPL